MLEAVNNLPASGMDYDIRLLEAEAAERMGIMFGEDWYDLPLIVREYNVATMVAQRWMESLMTLEIAEKAKYGSP